jgi:hypothetical protein
VNAASRHPLISPIKIAAERLALTTRLHRARVGATAPYYILNLVKAFHILQTWANAQPPAASRAIGQTDTNPESIDLSITRHTLIMTSRKQQQEEAACPPIFIILSPPTSAVAA